MRKRFSHIGFNNTNNGGNDDSTDHIDNENKHYERTKSYSVDVNNLNNENINTNNNNNTNNNTPLAPLNIHVARQDFSRPRSLSQKNSMKKSSIIFNDNDVNHIDIPINDYDDKDNDHISSPNSSNNINHRRNSKSKSVRTNSLTNTHQQNREWSRSLTPPSKTSLLSFSSLSSNLDQNQFSRSLNTLSLHTIFPSFLILSFLYIIHALVYYYTQSYEKYKYISTTSMIVSAIYFLCSLMLLTAPGNCCIYCKKKQTHRQLSSFKQ